MQTNKPADYPITAGGKIKRAIFAIIPLLHGFCCEVPYGQVAQSVEQRIENSPWPQKPSKTLVALAS